MLCREEDDAEPHGHVTSLAVLRTHRKLGIATKLMRATRELPCCIDSTLLAVYSLCCRFRLAWCVCMRVKLLYVCVCA